MKNIKKLPLILSILSILTFFTSAKSEIKVVASIKPIHSLASYLMDGVGKPDLIVVTTFTSALTGAIKVTIDKIVKISGIFFSFFIIYNLLGCYNITACNNITFISQAIK